MYTELRHITYLPGCDAEGESVVATIISVTT